MRYRKKPVEVEAHQWDGEHSTAAYIVGWILDNGHRAHYETTGMQNGRIVISTLEGDMQATPDDWIIQGVKGEFYPVRDDIFRETYEAVD
jgi:hypothetical protein